MIRHRVFAWVRCPVPAAVAVLLLVGLVSACSVDESMPAPRCDGGSGLIVAQSVPTAQLIPCFGSLPDGWTYQSVDIGQDGTEIQLDSDRAGSDAATLRFDESCELGPAVSVPSSYEDAQRFDDIERVDPGFRGRTHFVFEGGCVTWTFDFAPGVSATESVALADALALVERKVVNDNLRESFIDEEL